MISKSTRSVHLAISSSSDLMKHLLSHFVHSSPTLRPANIYIDAVSLSLLNGSTIDFATELIGSTFRVVDNPQSKGAGCGCGVSWELKEAPEVHAK